MLTKILCLVLSSLALTTAAPPSATTCQSVLAAAGADEKFSGLVAHAIHSMTVDDLRAFEPTVTENNRVPTINMDLSSPQAIVPYAQKRIATDVSKKFLTTGMETLDVVLSHMNQENWDINGFNALEKVVHAFHMREEWARVLVEYQRIKAQPPSEEFCRCATDVDNNGIMKMMRFNAMAIREPDLVYGSPTFSQRNANAPSARNVYGNLYSYRFRSVDPKSSLQDLVLQDRAGSMPTLKNKDSWQIWRGQPIPVQDDEGKSVRSSEHYQPALYLYCALNETS